MKTSSQAVSEAMASVKVAEPSKPVDVEQWARWARFDLRSGEQKPPMVQMVTEVAKFVRGVHRGEAPRWLSLLGNSGSGKTFLARRIFGWYSRSEHFRASVVKRPDGRAEVVYPGTFVWWPGFADDLLSNMGYGRLREMMDERLLVLDEIGADRDPNGHVKDCLSRLLCARVGKWTVVTSNRSLSQVSTEIDPRVSSRMIRDGSVKVEVEVEDYAVWSRRKK